MLNYIRVSITNKVLLTFLMVIEVTFMLNYNLL